jgi:hypothetical protein
MIISISIDSREINVFKVGYRNLGSYTGWEKGGDG